MKGGDSAEHWRKFAMEHVVLDEGQSLHSIPYIAPYGMLQRSWPVLSQSVQPALRSSFAKSRIS